MHAFFHYGYMRKVDYAYAADACCEGSRVGNHGKKGGEAWGRDGMAPFSVLGLVLWCALGLVRRRRENIGWLRGGAWYGAVSIYPVVVRGDGEVGRLRCYCERM